PLCLFRYPALFIARRLQPAFPYFLHSGPRPPHQRLPSSLVIENPRRPTTRPDLYVTRRGFPIKASDFADIKLAQLFHLRTRLRRYLPSQFQKLKEARAYGAIESRREETASRLAETQHDHQIVRRGQRLIGGFRLGVTSEIASCGIDSPDTAKLPPRAQETA